MHRRLTLPVQRGKVPSHGGKNMRIIGLGILALASTAGAVDITTVIGPYPAKIIEVTAVRQISQTVDAAAPYQSQLVMEVTGQYEAHGVPSKVGLKLNRTDDGRPMSYMSFEAEFFGIQDVTGPLGLGGGFITAVSNPEDFKVQILLQPQMWSKSDESYEANIAFKYRTYQPVQHEVSRGFTAMLRRVGGSLKWIVHDYGFPMKP